MKGKIEITDDLLKAFNGNFGKVSNIMIGQLLNNPYHNTGWFAKRRCPVSGNLEAMFDENFGNAIHDRKFIDFLLSLQNDGWELAYNISLNPYTKQPS